MKRMLTATLILVIMLVLGSQASAQVATFNSLSLHFSNTVLTTAQYQQVLEGPEANVLDQDSDYGQKQHLGALPTTGYLFGDNKETKSFDILAAPAAEAEPMAAALDKWISKELATQQPKRRGRQ